MIEKKNIPLRAVIFQRDDVWYAQCLEFDILAHSKTPKDLPYQFERAIVSHMAIAADNGLKPFENLPRAPERFWNMYESGMKVGPPKNHVFVVSAYAAPLMTEMSIAEAV